MLCSVKDNLCMEYNIPCLLDEESVKYHIDKFVCFYMRICVCKGDKLHIHVIYIYS